eukprot:scaffold64695_cov45-Attheya_sp.AAC.1
MNLALSFTLALAFGSFASVGVWAETSSGSGSGSSSATIPVIPWDDLQSSLSSPDILIGASFDAFINECYGIYHNDPGRLTGTLQQGSNWQLLDQPSGLCMNTLACGFDGCKLPATYLGADPSLSLEDAANILAAAAQDKSNLPHYVVHPTSAADVVASISFAKENGIPVTMKTSGHHYSGASTRKGTLLINTRGLPVYSIDESDTSSAQAPRSLIQECDSDAPDDGDESYLANACRLALARGKTGIVRVGGGEVWDQVLRSVLAYNDDPANVNGTKYLVVSGAAGTVSAAGGWLASGGNSAARGTRLYGYGVDQVLQMEMILPDGTHVRFGPAKWETDPEYLYPKTIAVKGFCNENPVADELAWKWTECNVVNFADLWMASRGGGGGTWGVVTSLVYQLHPRPLGGSVQVRFLPFTSPDDPSNILPVFENQGMLRELDEAVEDFKIDFYHNPSALGVLEEDSNACGCDYTSYPHFELLPNSLVSGTNEAICMGKKAAEAWAGAWKFYVTEGRGKERLLGGGFTESQIIEVGGWAYSEDWKERFGAVTGDDFDYVIPIVEEFNFFDDLTRGSIATEADAGFRPGHVKDIPRPLLMEGGSTSSNIPVDILMKNRDLLVPLLATMNARGSPWYVLGGASFNSHDQMTAIPQNKRNAGIYVHVSGEALEVVLRLLYENANQSNGSFPGYVGHNHQVEYGPLKEDWTKLCPLSYSMEEKQEFCISEQEAVWGTELLAKLEIIKAEMDPEYTMTCATGVGFGHISPPNEEDSSPVGSPGETSGGAAFNSAAAASLYTLLVGFVASILF